MPRGRARRGPRSQRHLCPLRDQRRPPVSVRPVTRLPLLHGGRPVGRCLFLRKATMSMAGVGGPGGRDGSPGATSCFAPPLPPRPLLQWYTLLTGGTPSLP